LVGIRHNCVPLPNANPVLPNTPVALPNSLPNVGRVTEGSKRQGRWRDRHPEQYREYMRAYMKKRRKALNG
jgi:hypothetical protein